MATRLASVDLFFPEAVYLELEQELRDLPSGTKAKGAVKAQLAPRQNHLRQRLTEVTAAVLLTVGLTMPASQLQLPAGLMESPRLKELGLHRFFGKSTRAHTTKAGDVAATTPSHGRSLVQQSQGDHPIVTGSLARGQANPVLLRFVDASLRSGFGLLGPAIP